MAPPTSAPRQHTETRGTDSHVTVRGTSSGTASKDVRKHDDRFVRPRVRAKAQSRNQSKRTTVFLNGAGGRIDAGYEDASANRSSIVWGEGVASIDVPGYRGGSSRWQSVVSCVQDHFDPYEIDIVSQRPAGDDYIMMMVGGRPSLVGLPSSVSGVAPFSGTVIDGSIGFVFSEAVGNDVEQTCNTAAHEIGHTLGLDHTYECTDLMSYLYGCGEKSFVDEDMRCGEWDARSCAGGRTRQNSHGVLAGSLGLRSTAPKNPTNPDPTPPKPQPPRTPADTQAPRISVQGTERWETSEGTVFAIGFEIADRSQIATVDLLWNNNGKTVTYRCGALPEHLPIECERTPDGYVFALLVGAGQRKFAIRSSDAHGNTSTTKWRVANFKDPSQFTDDDDWHDHDHDHGGHDPGCS